MSKRQQVTAVRVANVPDEQFERVVESDNPPTVTKLADMGTKRRMSSPSSGVSTIALIRPHTASVDSESVAASRPAIVSSSVNPTGTLISSDRNRVHFQRYYRHSRILLPRSSPRPLQSTSRAYSRLDAGRPDTCPAPAGAQRFATSEHHDPTGRHLGGDDLGCR